MTDEERIQWHREHVYPWANDAQWDCILLLCDFQGGFHHIDTRRVKPDGGGIRYTTRATFATYDNSKLTRFVKLCHEQCIRGEIGTAGMYLCLWLHKRKRDGQWHERHPTWEEATMQEEKGK